MGFLEKFFKKRPKPPPPPPFTDAVLGPMQWSEDNESWIGKCNGFEFALGYEGEPAPTPAVLDYAKDVLSRPDWLASTLAAEKKRWESRVPKRLLAELEGLRFGVIYFSMFPTSYYIFATLEGGQDPRCWRVEYHGHECDGMGFDT
jgi:hypothetical protein